MNQPIDLLLADERFLRGEHFYVDGKWRDITLTIKRIIPPGELKRLDNKEPIDTIFVEFEETNRLLGLACKVNRRLIKLLCGSNPIGKKVTLCVFLGDWAGIKNRPGIRIRMPKGNVSLFVSPKNYGHTDCTLKQPKIFHEQAG